MIYAWKTTVENAQRVTLLPIVTEHVLPTSTVYTDGLPSYNTLRRYGYRHERIQHATHVYVSGNVHTNTIEGFFGNVKRGISGNYRSISRKWLQGYLNEFVWRYNHRDDRVAMFPTLLDRSARRLDRTTICPGRPRSSQARSAPVYGCSSARSGSSRRERRRDLVHVAQELLARRDRNLEALGRRLRLLARLLRLTGHAC